MPPETPTAIRAYFDAVNLGRVEDVAAAFAPQGLVRDERADHRGRAAISAWAEDTLRRYRMRNEILSVSRDADHHIVLARVTGTFPGSPLDFTYRFALGPDGVETLEITL